MSEADVSEALEADGTASYPSAADRALIPVAYGPALDHGSFELTRGLARHDGALYGGTGAAASVLAMEAATQRDALWVVTQFIAQAHTGDTIDLDVDTLALGGRIAQLRVTARVGERTIFGALGATAHPRPGGLTGQYVPMPAVSPPEDSDPTPFGPPPDADDMATVRRLEFRVAEPARASSGGRAAGPVGAPGEPGEAPPGAMRLWARLRGHDRLTRAGVAYLADMVAPAVARAAGKLGAGFSLDNALRFADLPPAEWLLLDLHGELATNGYGHGRFTAWTPDGTLVATGSQTASMVHLFDADELDAWRSQRAATSAPIPPTSSPAPPPPPPPPG